MPLPQAEMFKVLGVESRIRIIELLKQRGPLTVTEMARELGITASAVSQHLKVLKAAGLVRNERKGYWIPYEIDASALEKCGELLSAVCTCGCGGSGNMLQADIEQAPDKLGLLRKHEKELERQLEEVRARIEELA